VLDSGRVDNDMRTGGECLDVINDHCVMQPTIRRSTKLFPFRLQCKSARCLDTAASCSHICLRSCYHLPCTHVFESLCRPQLTFILLSVGLSPMVPTNDYQPPLSSPLDEQDLSGEKALKCAFVLKRGCVAGNLFSKGSVDVGETCLFAWISNTLFAEMFMS